MKQIKAAVIGYGDRGSIYSSYSLLEPDKLKIVAVVDVNEFRLAKAQKTYSLSNDALFKNVDELLSSDIDVDLYINATMDQLHYEVLKKLLSTGKAVLTEKPIVNNEPQLLELEDLAYKNHTQVFVGHVLRYTPFYKRIKELVMRGEIGDIRTIEMVEHVGCGHYAGSYIRGRWRSEKECGSTMLLAKCCHDFDIMCWINNVSAPKYVSSFGGRYYFKEENAPEGATDFCYKCPHEKNCYYSAIKMYFESNFSCELTYTKLNKEEISDEDKMQFLKTDDFGRCVYKIKESDVVDRQVVSIEFANGSVGTFTLSCASPEACRTISIIGTEGEIEGKLETGIILLKKNRFNSTHPDITTIDVNNEVFSSDAMKGHSGGDYEIIKSVVEYMNGKKDMITITKLSDSINGHLCVYAADESRLSKKTIQIKRD